MSTISSYVGDGATRQFDITFPYSDAAAVFLRVNGVDVAFTFINASRVEAATAPASLALVEVYRKTSVALPAVDFTDGALVLADDLDASAAQPRERAEELDSEITALASKAVRVPGAESPMTLPDAASRAGKFLGFTAGGDPAALSGTGADSALRADLANPSLGVSLIALAAGLASVNAFTNLNRITVSPSGTLTVSGSTLFEGVGLDLVATADNAASPVAGGGDIPTLLNVSHTFGGTAINSGRNAVGAHLHMVAATSATNPYRYYSAVNAVADTSVNDGGTALSPKGYLYGVGGVARLKTGATYWSSAIAGDFELSCQTGTSVAIKAGCAVLEWPDDAVAGTLVDTLYWGTKASTAIGMTTGVLFDDSGGGFPIIAGGTVFKATGAGTPTVGHGIDFRGINVAGYLLAGNGKVYTTSAASDAISAPNGGATLGGNLSFAGFELATSKQVFTPTTGQTLTITKRLNIVNPAGTLANLTITLPTAAGDGDIRVFTFTKAITTLAWTGTTSGFPTTMAANSRWAAVWDSGTSTWFPA